MNILTGEFALLTSFIFETWIQDKLIVRIFGQEHLRLYIMWLCQIQSVLWHDIEVERLLLTTLIDDEILYLVGISYRILAIVLVCNDWIVNRFFFLIIAILIAFYESEHRVVCLENPRLTFGIDILERNHRSAFWETVIYLVAKVCLSAVRDFNIRRGIDEIESSSILPFLNGRSNGELAHLSVEEITINYQFSVSDGISSEW